MSDLCAFIPEERPTNDLMDGGRFWGSRLVKLSAVQHAYLLDAKKPTRVSFKMLMGEYAQALLLGEGKGCELRGDTGQQYFTFDKISMDETITFMGKPIVDWHNEKPQIVYVEHKYVGDASYRFYGLTLMQILAYYGWSLQFPRLQTAPFKGGEVFNLDLRTYRKDDINEMLFAIVIDGSKINTYALPCQETAKGFAFEVSEYYNRKGNAIRDFLKHKQWPVLRKWERENSPQEDFFIDQAMDYFTIKSFQIP